MYRGVVYGDDVAEKPSSPATGAAKKACPKCSTEMVAREKDGSRYYACPNWKDCGQKCIAIA